jgi:alkanesulfonate monooxygenase SsuD/methylene tetrahydromethanopterin reductase-like flavin-dependent oxidoreductase (luciferase family)
MEIGVGLPNAIPDVDRDSLLEFAKRADAKGFTSLGTVDRVVYPGFEPLVSLAAVAAVTERIRLATTVMLGPLRSNAVLLAKECATLDHLADGRFWLGIGLGARQDDYEVSGISWDTRGAALTRQLEQIRRTWEGDEVGPKPLTPGGPKLIVGGHASPAIARAARFGDGWIMGAAGPDQFAELAPKVDEAWQQAGRPEKPWKASLAYFSLGPDAEGHAERNIGHYYEFLGDYTSQIVQSVATTPEMVHSYIQAFEQAGCDELIFFPGSRHTHQADELAGVVGK